MKHRFRNPLWPILRLRVASDVSDAPPDSKRSTASSRKAATLDNRPSNSSLWRWIAGKQIDGPGPKENETRRRTNAHRSHWDTDGSGQ